MRDIGRDLCVSLVIWASRRALRNGEIIRICMGQKRFLLQFKNANEFSIKISLPELPCLMFFLLCCFWSDWARFQCVLVPYLHWFSCGAVADVRKDVRTGGRKCIITLPTFLALMHYQFLFPIWLRALRRSLGELNVFLQLVLWFSIIVYSMTSSIASW